MPHFRPLLAVVTNLACASLAADFPKPYDSEKGSPMPAEEVARTMELPPGFKCQVFAAEPDVQQPIAMAWDRKARLWVAENYTYAENPRRWDTALQDRLIILEDKDGDGKQDGRKVFWEQGSYLTSVELGYGGVWILNAGTLSFIADRNGDDVPDGAPEVLLDGFNVKTIGHNIVNGLRWGPDGWLYGRHGITDTSAVGAPGTPLEKRTKLNCALWRYHPVRKVFEVVCHGGTNSWGHDWNQDGQLFYINTVIGHLWHAIPGAYYRRMFGAHLNPHVYEVIEQTADHFHWDAGAETWSDIRKLGITGKTDTLGGGHAHVGMLIYQGGTWPKEYHGSMLTCNLHGNRINVDKLERQGCGYVGKHAPDFMKAKDKWFRGIELLTGPDGNVFVADWSDTGECHDSDGVHRSSGRIYKIVYGGPKKAEPVNVAAMKDEELANLLESPNNWWSRMARQTLIERAGAPKTLIGNSATEEAKRVQALRQLGETDISSLAGACAKAAKEDPSGLVRIEVASALQRIPLEARWPIATALAQHEEDANDRQQPLMIWYGIEPAVAANLMKGVELVGQAKIPTVRRLVARRISEEIEKQPAAVDALVALAATRMDIRDDILRGMAAGLEGWSKAAKPKRWEDLAKGVTGQGELADSVRQLSIVFGGGRPAKELLAIINDVDSDAAARRNAFESLFRSPNPDLLPIARNLINDKILAVEARKSLASFDDPSVPAALLKTWPERSLDQQAATVDTLISRPSYAQSLLRAVESGKCPSSAITPYQARQIRSLGDAELSKKLTAVWGELRDTPEAKKAELVRWRERLTVDTLASADKATGRAIFQAVCATCHKLYGQGGVIGPELTGSDRGNLNYLLENILDPSAIVPNDFRMTVLTLKDGRVITGVVPQQTEKVVTVQTPAERLLIERASIASTQGLAMSMMPEGLLSALTPEQARDLIAYLMAPNNLK